MKIALVGTHGRMGVEITSLLMDDKKWIPYLGVTRQEKKGIFNFYSYSLNTPLLENADIIIDFSSVDALDSNLRVACAFQKPYLTGITGISECQRMLLKQAGDVIPVLWSSNMSMGIQILLKMIEQMKSVKKYDFQVEELHHRQKKDAPSGTALLIQEKLNAVTEKINPVPLVVRGGGVIGKHKIYAMADDEIITIEHDAINRKVFARGALDASEWLLKQKNGFYTMAEVVSFESSTYL